MVALCDDLPWVVASKTKKEEERYLFIYPFIFILVRFPIQELKIFYGDENDHPRTLRLETQFVRINNIIKD